MKARELSMGKKASHFVADERESIGAIAQAQTLGQHYQFGVS